VGRREVLNDNCTGAARRALPALPHIDEGKIIAQESSQPRQAQAHFVMAFLARRRVVAGFVDLAELGLAE
jgi:hypothetical protein